MASSDRRLVATVNDRGGELRRLDFARPEIMIGRVGENHVVLPRGNVSKRHARLVLKDGRMILVDLRSTNGTYVNGRRLVSPLVIRADDEVVIGDFVLRFDVEELEHEDTVEVPATELRLLAAIAQRDEASRLVYADWLEEHGDDVRAEFLRVQQELVAMSPGDPALLHRVQRMRELAQEIDVRWRYKVARPVIENCLAVELACPRDWGQLATTERSDVRYCGACAQRVYYCETVGDARRHVGRGECVAVDVGALRRSGDLDPPEPRLVMGRMMRHPDGPD